MGVLLLSAQMEARWNPWLLILVLVLLFLPLPGNSLDPEQSPPYPHGIMEVKRQSRIPDSARIMSLSPLFRPCASIPA